MRLIALGAVQSLILSVYNDAPTIIDTKLWALDATLIVSTPDDAFPLASSLLVADASTVPFGLLSARGVDQNSSLVQTLAVDIVPQLLRHQLPDPLTSLALFAGINALRSNTAVDAYQWCALAVTMCQLSNSPHHQSLALAYGASGLYRWHPLVSIALAGTMMAYEGASFTTAIKQLSSTALFASEPLHSAIIGALPSIVSATRDLPPALQDPIFKIVRDALKFGDQVGGGILQTYMDIMQQID